MRVMVLEDDPELGPVVAAQLRDAGFAVDLARTLAEADLKLSVNRYDCVVADRSVPDTPSPCSPHSGARDRCFPSCC